jgi:hypothetical protein
MLLMYGMGGDATKAGENFDKVANIQPKSLDQIKGDIRQGGATFEHRELG